jgi:cytoskeletal protein CcmA (bactofilin family)
MTARSTGTKHIPAGGKSTAPTLLTVTGDGARIEGRFEIADSIQIDCEVAGELTIGGKLVIGEKGVVTAEVRTVDAVIHGIYDGTMVATGEVEIAATGRVNGTVETRSLVVSKGGVFNGTLVEAHEAAPVGLAEESP